MIILSILLFLSVCVNGLLVWYCKRLTKQFLFLAENVGDLEIALQAFGSHLKGVHELEMFYGDETLGALIEHSKAIVDRMGEFYEGFSLDTQEQDEEDLDGPS